MIDYLITLPVVGSAPELCPSLLGYAGELGLGLPYTERHKKAFFWLSGQVDIILYKVRAEHA